MSSITDRVLKTLKPTGKDYRIRDKAGVGSGYHGFGVKVSARGKRTFFLEYTLGGKRRFLNLGHYPAKKLKGAREEAKQARTLINQGVDPQLERARIEAEQEEERKRIEAENRATTVNEVLDFYLGTLRETTGKEVERLLINRYCNVRKRIGDRKMKDIVEDDVEDLLDVHLNRGTRRNAGKLYSSLASAFKQARQHKPFELKGWVNPFNDIPKPKDSSGTPRDRALSVDEIRAFLNLMEGYHSASDGIKGVLKLILFTGQRVEQVSRMQWEHVDLEERLWRVPPDETKMGKSRTRKTLLVPMTDIVLEVIHAMPMIEGNGFVFPGVKEDSPYDLGSFAHALIKMLRQSDIEHFTPRDLRRTVTTHLARLGVSKEIRSKIQDHSLGGDVEDIHYDQHDYLKEKRVGLERWERELQRIISSNEKDNVVQLHG
jgi:integrase